MSEPRKKPRGFRNPTGKRLRLARQDARAKARMLLEKELAEFAPQLGNHALSEDSSSKDGENNKTLFSAMRLFEELPMSTETLQSLQANEFTRMTPIQRAALPHALCGRDVLGAARTGSGKTLTFLIPLLERLHRCEWGPHDGLGALVISPTRELAMQIFQVLRKVGAGHRFSGGLLIGGKDVRREKKLVTQMNILVCTPGRLLHHMDETYGFNCDQVRMVVLDEADRILDMGFRKTINAIFENLPSGQPHTRGAEQKESTAAARMVRQCSDLTRRQTLLFSATQTKSVKQLARLSLYDPQYIDVEATQSSVTPEKLTQRFCLVLPQDKLNFLFSFVKTHLRQKCIVFLSSCKEARFFYELFCKLRPGTPIRHLHGRMKQFKRIDVYDDFMQKDRGVLFATDIAARGLDFPDVDWVVQMDCPEDTDTYVHRVGRTARSRSKGSGILVLAPSEVAFVGMLTAAKVPIERIRHDPKRIVSITGQVSSILTQFPEIRYLAQRAFISYMRSIHIAANKEVFQLEAINAPLLATSWGLPGAPRMRFSRAGKQKKKKNKQRVLQGDDEMGGDWESVRAIAESDSDGASGSDSGKDRDGTAKDADNATRAAQLRLAHLKEASLDAGVEDGALVGEKYGADSKKTRVERVLTRKNQGVFHETRERLRVDSSDDEDSDLDAAAPTRRYADSGGTLIRVEGSNVVNEIGEWTKEDEEALARIEKQRELAQERETQVRSGSASQQADSSFWNEVKDTLAQRDEADHHRERERVRSKHRKIRMYLKNKEQMEEAKKHGVQGRGASGLGSLGKSGGGAMLAVLGSAPESGRKRHREDDSDERPTDQVKKARKKSHKKSKKSKKSKE